MNNSQHNQYDLSRLKSIPIAEVARRLGLQVWRSGVNHKALCPWHDDHNPSLGLVTGTGKNFCYCYTCGKGGSTIDLAMHRKDGRFRKPASGCRPHSASAQRWFMAIPRSPRQSPWLKRMSWITATFR